MSMLCLFGDDEEILNPHQIAWSNRDWDAVKKLIEEYKEKPENEFFLVLNNINVDKRELDVSHIESYSKFAIDNMLSQHIECISTVYNANMFMTGLPDQAHYNYLTQLIPRGRRFSKALKLDEGIKDQYIIKLLSAYYKVNPQVAYDYKVLLTRKGKLDEVLSTAKFLATDEFLKSITKNPKEIKELKQL
ncbi:sliding clamp loader small subunit [Acinetobacter phage Minot]|nr:sliding clamp loader small subunit [Acinetobacter phage Minot]QQO96546.1 small sliding clamp loader [Acinetobacter phage Mokit]QQO96801.1 clamp loader small subunit [Acinetobacter phage Melin]